MREHRQLGVEALDHVWTLMEKPGRTGEEDFVFEALGTLPR